MPYKAQALVLAVMALAGEVDVLLDAVERTVMLSGEPAWTGR